MVLAHVLPERKPERGYVRMFPRNLSAPRSPPPLSWEKPRQPRPPPPPGIFEKRNRPPLLLVPRTPPSPPPSRKNKKYPKRPPRVKKNWQALLSLTSLSVASLKCSHSCVAWSLTGSTPCMHGQDVASSWDPACALQESPKEPPTVQKCPKQFQS